MKNPELFKRDGFKYVNAVGHTHIFTIVVHQGMDELPTDYKPLTDTNTVEVKVFKAVINEIIMDTKGRFSYARNYDFPALCSRSDHANIFVREVKKCKTPKEIIDLVEDLRVDFNPAIERDVRTASRRLVGTNIPVTNKTVPTRREPTPLTKPKYPYWGKSSHRGL